MNKYESLKKQYSERISLNQLYQICHISKCSARYLVQNGIIPCVENRSNKTWRYTIALDDVITYLRRREQLGSMIPRGAATSKKKRKKKKLPAIYTGNKEDVEAYFQNIFAYCPDAMTTAEISKATGLHNATIRKMIKTGKLKAVSQHKKYFIPKQYFLDFVATQEFFQCKSNSKVFQDLIARYSPWAEKRKR